MDAGTDPRQRPDDQTPNTPERGITRTRKTAVVLTPALDEESQIEANSQTIEEFTDDS